MFLSFLLALFFLPFSLQATDNFTITQNLEYLVNPNGEATVTHLVDIANNSSETYPTQYQIQIYGFDIRNLSATDENGNILDALDINSDLTTIKLKLNHPKVGKDQINRLKLIYHIPDFAKHKGKTWEIIVPQLGQNVSPHSQITLKVPTSFGRLSFASIPLKIEESQNQNIVSFKYQDKKNLIIFGNYQLFNFKLDYHLENPEALPVSTEIAIVPDTHSQSVYYQSIEPPPTGIRIDGDGNWLAHFNLKPKQKLDVTVRGQVKTGLKFESKLNNPQDYLSQQTFWPVNDPQILSLAQTLTTPLDIYNHVVANLSYNYSRTSSAGRLGALSALSDPKNSVCTEFTDLFVTLARAKNIPAREIEGFAYTNNPKIKPVNPESDILHAWPEFYDFKNESWQQIDPTWGNTTNGIDYFTDLDLNHITFVTHGLDSQNPPPPGSYKKDFDQKTIFIDFANEELIGTPALPKLFFTKDRLLLQNSSPNSIKNLSLSVPKLNFHTEISTILPYSSQIVDLPSPDFLHSLNPTYKTISITLEDVEGQSATQTINYLPHFINLGLTIVIALLILAIGGIIITSRQHEKAS